MNRCPDCYGDGWVYRDAVRVTCPSCGGCGEHVTWLRCERCGGTGYRDSDPLHCPACGGEGMQRQAVAAHAA